MWSVPKHLHKGSLQPGHATASERLLGFESARATGSALPSYFHTYHASGHPRDPPPARPRFLPSLRLAISETGPPALHPSERSEIGRGRLTPPPRSHTYPIASYPAL